MNKAFMKEPEPGSEYCPRCHSLGQPVSGATLDALIQLPERQAIGQSACFCPFPSCDVAYFDSFDRVISHQQLQRAVYPKDPTAPICPCFGLTVEDIEADIAEGTVTRVKAHRLRTTTEARQCHLLTGNGLCCTPEVQKQFMRLKGGSG